MRWIVTLLVTAASLAAAPTAFAFDWTPVAGYGKPDPKAFDGPAPRVAVAIDGSSVSAWTLGRNVVAVTGDHRGHFGSEQVLGRFDAGPPAVAAGPGGAAIVAWEESDGIHVAVRGTTSGPLKARRVTGSTASAINGVTIARDPRGGWVLAERIFPFGSHHEYGVRTIPLRADGSLALPPLTLGQGDFGIDADPVQALSVAVDGTATLIANGVPVTGGSTGTAPTATSGFAQAAHGAAFGPLRPLPGTGTFSEARVATPGVAGTAYVTATSVADCGDAGCFGAPAAWRIRGGVATQLGSIHLDRPNFAFMPSIAPFGPDKAALVFSLKTHSTPFSRVAPVRAQVLDDDGPTGPLQTLTTRDASEPVAVALSRGRVLVMWTGPRGFGTSLAGADGTFKVTAPPKGPPPGLGHDNATNRDISAAGSYALVGWERAGRVRLTLRRF